VRNTDGVALTQAGFGPFPAGAFYAGHDDGDVAAFSWFAPTRWGCAKTARSRRRDRLTALPGCAKGAGG
jgi:hypothetical protein